MATRTFVFMIFICFFTAACHTGGVRSGAVKTSPVQMESEGNDDLRTLSERLAEFPKKIQAFRSSRNSEGVVIRSSNALAIEGRVLSIPSGHILHTLREGAVLVFGKLSDSFLKKRYPKNVLERVTAVYTLKENMKIPSAVLFPTGSIFVQPISDPSNILSTIEKIHDMGLKTDRKFIGNYWMSSSKGTAHALSKLADILALPDIKAASPELLSPGR